MLRGDGGAAAVLLIAVAGMSLLMAVFVADTGRYLAAAATASTAADAAALAAAPVTFAAFGATGSPQQEAATFATANGASLVRCVCPVDRSFAAREVVVETSVGVDLLLLGNRTVRSSSRARFEPANLVPTSPPIGVPAPLR